MRRLLAVGVAAGALLIGSGVAGAQEETPTGTFSSPTRAIAGAPIWVRSITPCPVTAGAYQFVRVGISAQSEPSISYLEFTDDDLDDDGSWMVTLSAPADMPNGITKSYDIQAQCIEVDQPYLAPSRTATTAAPTGDPSFSYQRYFMRRLYVTGFGGSDAAAIGAPSGDTTTTTSTTTSTTAPATNNPATDLMQSAAVRSPELSSAGLQPAALAPTTTWVSDEAQRAAEARAELARLADGDDGAATFSASPVVASKDRPQPDGGIPWWSFVLATMLAVGTVVGFGQRRQTSR